MGSHVVIQMTAIVRHSIRIDVSDVEWSGALQHDKRKLILMGTRLAKKPLMIILSPAELGSRRCQPCEGGVEPCPLNEAKRQTLELRSGWELAEGGKKISRKFKLTDFAAAMRFLNAVAEVAEQDQHHPDLHLTAYRQVRIDLTTHSIGGLSENDFILAVKIDRAFEQL
jgi:4a-hydroxytetrahydrobiopterin dehydratase